jgi:uncharacterized protein (DUF58 family)
MYAPRTSLIVTAAVVGSVLAIGASVAPAFGLLALAVFLAFALIAAWDAQNAIRSARALEMRAPQLIRTVRHRQTALPVTLLNAASDATPLRLSVSPELPEVLKTDEPVLAAGATLPPAHGVDLTFRFHCARRGEYAIARCHVESISRFGWWVVHTTMPCAATVRVYPDLRKDRTAARFMKRGQMGSQLVRTAGKGREFDKLRDYLPGDAWDEVEWKATARRGRPVVQTFRAERDQEIYVAIDGSRLSARLSEGDTILERYVYSALVLALAAESQGDRFGLITFSDRVHKLVRARSGRNHFSICRDAIYKLQPRPVEPDFGEFFSFLETRLTRRALVIVLTSLDDPLIGETFGRNVGLASRRHLVIAGVPELEGARPLFQKPAADNASVYADLAGHLRWRQLGELRRGCERKGVRLHTLNTRRISADLAAIYLEVKRRQTL